MSDEIKSPSPHAPAFRLEAQRPVVTRLSKKALATICAFGGVTIGGVLIYALLPRSPHVPRELLAEPGKPGAASLMGAPSDYSQVPKLGPPLPGDLGRPIVSAQRRSADDGDVHPRAEPSHPSVAASIDRRTQEKEAARSSGLFLGDRANVSATTAPGHPLLERAPEAEAAIPTGPGQVAKRSFLAGDRVEPFISDARVEPAPSRLLIQAGSVLPAALLTGIRSDLPGQLTAQVTQNVYDSPTGRILLIPQGAKLLGEYDSDLEAGQTRVMMVWTRLLLPGGASLVLDRLPGSDAAGFAGLQDGVNRHWGNVVRAAAISTLLGIGAELGSNDDDALVRALRRGSQNSVIQAGNQIVQREIGIAPTLMIRPGHPLRVMVKRDIIFSTGEGEP